MRLHLWLSALLFLPLLNLPAQEKSSPVQWKKTVIDTKFRSEGATVADVNKDGKMDILTGEVWYEAPEWKMHEIRKPAGDYGAGQGYSTSFACWADDFNSDGWLDVLVIRFPGAPCFWYENPQGKPGHWKEHLIHNTACNETPQFVDLFGKGKRVLIMGIQPSGKGDGNEGQMCWLAPGSDPTRPWEVHAISETSKPGKPIPGTFRYAHGLGVGDVNSDGRLDVIVPQGWWEQPEKVDGKPWVFHPTMLNDAVADIFVHDMDGDGKNDLLASSAHKFGIWYYHQRPGNPHPAFVKFDLFRELLSETHAMHFVDINGDGLKDLVTGKRWWSHFRSEPGHDWPAMIYWFEASVVKSKDGKTKETRFTPRVVDTDSGIGTQFWVGDFNGDGLPDIVTSNKKGTFLFEQVRKP